MRIFTATSSTAECSNFSSRTESVSRVDQERGSRRAGGAKPRGDWTWRFAEARRCARRRTGSDGSVFDDVEHDSERILETQ